MNTQRLAEYALRAYTEHTFEVDGAQVLVEKTSNGLVVAFRGTEGAEDLITDLRASPWYAKEMGVWCHAGFLKSLRPLLKSLDRPVFRAKKVTLTGHSLGGAMAQIYAAYLVKKGLNPDLTTFGAPRAGMQGLSDLSSQCHGFRFVRDGDTIPNIPLHIPFLFPYTHDRPEIELDGADGIFNDHGMLGYLSVTPSMEV